MEMLSRFLFLFFFFFLRFYLFFHERHREADTKREAETQVEGDTGSPGEPDAGLNPRTPGSQPEPKADAQPLGHPGALLSQFIWLFQFKATLRIPQIACDISFNHPNGTWPMCHFLYFTD